jgi:hypothetical protein
MRPISGRTLYPLACEMYPDYSFLISVMTSMTTIAERSWAENIKSTEFLEKSFFLHVAW